MKVLFILCVLLPAGILSYAQQSNAVRNVTPAEFKKAMDTLSDEVVLDVRTTEEVENGKIPGAVTIDFYGDNFKSQIEALDRNRPYLLYCAAGSRSGQAAELMRKMGFTRIYNLEDGYKGWVKEKMPVVDNR